ncbi:hypothetical protein P43SY_005229 [Pythium insidiosum]|uniref:Uncharacterized protein n=1 Tax=Pythium insidiosum TaxID=114742 RepID=A0AAD5LES7_PYTIN|nr:hypothetical protein P43SY_005229 [Pythium insidiosum]
MTTAMTTAMPKPTDATPQRKRPLPMTAAKTAAHTNDDRLLAQPQRSAWSCVWRALWPPRRVNHARAVNREPPDKRPRAIETPDACTMRWRAAMLDEIEALGQRPRRPARDRRPTACPNCGRRNVDYGWSSCDDDDGARFCSLDCRASFDYRAVTQRAVDRHWRYAASEELKSIAPTAPTTPIASSSELEIGATTGAAVDSV